MVRVPTVLPGTQRNIAILTQSGFIFYAPVHRGTQGDELVTAPSARMLTVGVKRSL
jgi:hypothetical protein